MSRLRGAPLPLFAVVSVALHVALFGVAVRRSSSALPRPAFASAAPPLAGDTLDVEPPSTPAEPDDFDPGNATTAPSMRARRAPASAATAPTLALGHSAHEAASGSATVAAAPPTLFGAVGERSASDLPTSFTRNFPQAASADPIWAHVAYGAAGTAEIALVLDESGRLTRTSVAGSASDALRRGIDRTLAILGPRPFTARGAVTRLRVVAHVSRDAVHDGLHGDVFALSSGSFSGDVGMAFFTLPGGPGPGRRVDVEVRLLP